MRSLLGHHLLRLCRLFRKPVGKGERAYVGDGGWFFGAIGPELWRIFVIGPLFKSVLWKRGCSGCHHKNHHKNAQWSEIENSIQKLYCQSTTYFVDVGDNICVINFWKIETLFEMTKLSTNSQSVLWKRGCSGCHHKNHHKNAQWPEIKNSIRKL